MDRLSAAELMAKARAKKEKERVHISVSENMPTSQANAPDTPVQSNLPQADTPAISAVVEPPSPPVERHMSSSAAALISKARAKKTSMNAPVAHDETAEPLAVAGLHSSSSSVIIATGAAADAALGHHAPSASATPPEDAGRKDGKSLLASALAKKKSDRSATAADNAPRQVTEFCRM